MLLYYRFSSEHAGSYRQCALSSSALSLRETKQLLANECGLAGEYLRKIDFRIFVAGERRKTQPHQHVGSTSSEGGGSGAGEEDLVEVVDEHQMIHAYSYLVVQRVGLVGERVGGVYVHTLAKRQLSKEAWRCEEEIYLQRTGAARVKKPVPPEWLCGLCDGVMTQPVLVKCLGSCTQSACRSCLDAALRAARGSCPFCGAGFRQVIRNKRLEEIINHANLQEFEIPPPSAAPHQKAIDRATAAREKGGKGGGDDAGARGGGGGGGSGRGTGSCSEGSTQKSEGTAAALLQQTAAARGERGGTRRGVQVKAGSCDKSSSQTDGERGEPAAETPFQHFVYLLPQKNLQLMRARDMMLVDGSSALAAALSAAPSSAQGGDDAGTSTCAPEGLAEGDLSESDVDLEGRDAFLVPLCASGGGTSFCIGGFVRINSHNKVDISTDRVAQSVARQWQQVSDVGSSSHGGDHNGTSNIFLYRVNWLEKYGTMPMLPSRKQPLGGLVGANRRPVVSSFGLGSSSSNSNLVPGLVQRSMLPFGTLEVVVAPSKFEDVIASIRDYAQFGSRPTDPWQYPASNSAVAGAPASAPSTPATAAAVSAPSAADASTSVSSSHKAFPAAAHRATHTAAGDTGGGGKELYPPPVPPPPPPLPPGAAPLPPYHGHKSVSGEVAVPGEGRTGFTGTAVAFGGVAAGGAATSVLSGVVAVDESARDVVTHQVAPPEGESEPHAGIPAALGPPPLDLYGGPGEEANPYMGYCAILPFLTEEQFWHIRRMQKKAIRLCGYKRPMCNSSTSSSTSSSSTSSKEGRERWRGVTRSSKRRRHRVFSTESSTGSDSSYGTSNSDEQRKGREVRLSKGSTCRPSEGTSKEDAARGGKLTSSEIALVPSGEVTSTSQIPCESRVDEGDAASTNTTDKSDTSSLQRRGSVGTPSLAKDTVNMATRARARPAAGKPLPVVPPPLSNKHTGNLGSPRTGASLSAKAKEDTLSTLPPVKPES